ncbi:CRP-like cAMP-binding protein [Breznakibacter xylanolyticus]|uniref:CRP-like cAMP-binding protein n=1 Tax=Breznakibacter xylanolyticus TaxID=990 RepID=A0A2W7NQA3_9BACT|nr:Crp/Fnr family transcriptional regulator [Breznakibacter xylanolyticus]PZX20297.1 CRP-like cAMP-binding protein [Breznakibacter xylanolyticus]
MMEDILAMCPLFRGMRPLQVIEVLEKVHYQVKRYQRDDIVAFGGDECLHLHIVISGSVKGEMVDFSGKSIKIEDIEAPRPLALAFLFGRENRYPVNIVANNEVVLLVLPKDSVLQLLQLSMVFLSNYLNVVSNRAQFLSDKLRFLSFRSLRGKVAHYLLNLSGGKAIEVVVPNSQEELAEMFGVARPSLARTIREMHNEGLIHASARNIQIVNRDALVALLEQ